MTFQTYNINGNITSVDVASTDNLIGSYFNGDSNNGVNSSLIFPFGTIQIDGLLVTEGMTVLLSNQTNANENGIYICTKTGSSILNPILQRRNDFQCIEQIKSGQYVLVGNGSSNKGSIFTITDPLPNRFGIDPLIIISQSTDINLVNNTPNPSALNGGESYAFTSTYTQKVPINDVDDKIGAILGRLNMNGITVNLPGYAAGVTGDLELQSGTYQAGLMAGTLSTLNLKGTTSPTTINSGTEIYGFAARFTTYPDVPNDISGIYGLGILNFTSPFRIGSFIRCVGWANRFASFDNATTSYFVTAGSSPGSAGDPTKCNANNVLVCSFDNVPCYIPIFNSNA